MAGNPLTQDELLNYGSQYPNPPQFPPGYFFATPVSGTGPLAYRLFDAGYISIGVIDPDRLGTGAAGLGSLYLADDGTWKSITVATPTLAQVTTAGNTTTNTISIGGLTVATNLIYTDTVNSRVGIGTNSPAVTLHVQNGGSTPKALFQHGTLAHLGVIIGSTGGGFTVEDNNFFAIWHQDYANRSNETGLTERMRITTGGNILIGTTTDSGYKLNVNGSIKSGSANQSALLVQASGTATTQAAIAIQQLTTEGDTIIFADYEPYAEYGIIARNSIDSIDFTGGTSTGSLDNYSITNRSGNTRTAYTKFRVGLGTGNTYFGGNVGIGTTSLTYLLNLYSNTSNAQVSIQAPSSTMYLGADWGLGYTNSTSDIKLITSNLTRVAVKANGNVGIGTTSPNSKLEVAGLSILTNSGGSSYNENIRLPESTNGWSSIVMGGAIATSGTGPTVWSILKNPSGNGHRFGIMNNATERFTIFTSGNVSVGTTTDAGYKLDVTGLLRNTDSAYFATSSGSVGIKTTSPRYNLEVNGTAYIKYLTAVMAGEGFNDTGMLGILYDRNELTNASYRGGITVTISGSGTFSNDQAVKNRLVNAVADYFTIDGLSNESLVTMVIDTGANVYNYGTAYWQPFFQSRTTYSPTATFPESIVVEVSTDNITWYAPATGWSISNFTTNNLNGLWMGTRGAPGIPGNVWRYARFTLSNFNVGTNYGLWISQIGVRHTAAPVARQFANTLGDTFYGNLIVSGTNKLGVGTSTPNASLDVSGTFNLLGGVSDYWLKGFQGNSAVNGNAPFLALVNNNTIANATYGWLFYDSSADGSFNLYRRNNSTTGNQVFTISRSNGNFLINTSTDAGYKLDVNGTARFSNTLTLGGSSFRVSPNEFQGIISISNTLDSTNNTSYINIGTFSDSFTHIVVEIELVPWLLNTSNIGSYAKTYVIRMTSAGLGVVDLYDSRVTRDIGFVGSKYQLGTPIANASNLLQIPVHYIGTGSGNQIAAFVKVRGLITSNIDKVSLAVTTPTAVLAGTQEYINLRERVGINTSTPFSTLTVNGIISSGNNLNTSGGSTFAGELRSYQQNPSPLYLSLQTTSAGNGKSGLFRSNTDYILYYDLSTGDTVVNSSFLSSAIKFTYQNSEKARMFSTGNWVIQDSGTFTDAGYRLDVQGSTRFQGLSLFRGTTASDTTTLSSELATTGSGTNWTGTGFSTGYTHTPGSTTALTTTLAAVVNTTYEVVVTVTGRTAGTVSLTFGGVTTLGRSATFVTGIYAETTGVLSFTPTTDFDGTIVVSIKSVASNVSPIVTWQNSSGTINAEMRVVNQNIAIGQNAGQKFSTTSNTNYNTFLGYNSGQKNISAYNTFIGYNAGLNNTSGGQSILPPGNGGNTFVGAGAGQLNTVGHSNAFFGSNSGPQNTSGSYNVFFGATVAYSNTTGSNNVAIGGYSALAGNTTGSYNVALGAYSLASSNTVSYNTGIGSGTLRFTTGANNLAAGANALTNNTTGANNIGIGTDAGRYITGGTALTIINDSIFIGASTKAQGDNQTNQIVIGYNLTGLGSNTITIGNSANSFTSIQGGNLGVGTTTNAGYRLDVNGTARIQGNTTITGTLTTAPTYTNCGLTASVNVAQDTTEVLGFSAKIDPNGWWNPGTKRWTPTVYGFYYVTLQVKWDPGTPGNQINIQILRNGGTVALCQDSVPTSVGVTQTTNAIIEMNGTTDYVTFTAYSSSTTGEFIVGEAQGNWTFFNAFKLN